MNDMLPIEETNITQIIENEKSKVPNLNKIIIIGVAVIMAIIAAIIVLNVSGSKVKTLQKIFPQLSDIKIICSEPLEDSWEYVLWHGKTADGEIYLSDAIDFKNEINYDGFIENPFYSLCAYVRTQGDEEINKKLFYEMKKCIDEGGLDYFNNRENSSNFLRDITGVGGIIPTDEARNIMFTSLELIYGEEKFNQWLQQEDFRLLFERQTALPKALAYQTTEMKYNWHFPEHSFNVMDSQLKNQLTNIYGPAYISETRWYPGVINEETGDISSETYFTSLESLKKRYDVYETGDMEEGTYEGEWKDGKKNGQGTRYYADGKTESGKWEKDKYVG